MTLPAHILAALNGSMHARTVLQVAPAANRAPVFAPAAQATPRASRLQDTIADCGELETHDIGDPSTNMVFDL